MAAMGLPTSLRPHTHFAGRNAEYEVRSSLARRMRGGSQTGSARRAAQVYARDDEAPSTEATLGVEEEPAAEAAARDGQEPAARQPRGRKPKASEGFHRRCFVEASSIEPP